MENFPCAITVFSQAHSPLRSIVVYPHSSKYNVEAEPIPRTNRVYHLFMELDGQ